jgi:hypothetical protein
VEEKAGSALEIGKLKCNPNNAVRRRLPENAGLAGQQQGPLLANRLQKTISVLECRLWNCKELRSNRMAFFDLLRRHVRWQ